MENLEHILEGLLFVSGDGLDKGYIMEKLGVTDKQIEKAVEKLQEKYCEDCGIHLIKFKNKLQFTSNSQYAEDIAIVLNPIRERALSKATLETVAIIAYKQPITRLDVEEIRGVNSDYAIQQLLQHNMIEVVGRKDAVGKPLLFGTTEEFLKKFELNDLSDLPDYEELLSMIDVIENQDNSLYNNFEIPDEEKETALENASESMVDVITENVTKSANKDMSLEEMANLIDDNQEYASKESQIEDLKSAIQEEPKTVVNTKKYDKDMSLEDIALEDLPEDFELQTNIPEFLKRK